MQGMKIEAKAGKKIMEQEFESRNLLVQVCREVYEREMVSSSGGNISVRTSEGLLITPTGFSLGKIKLEDIVSVNLEGVVVGSGKPSKELPLHLRAYRARQDIAAVVHVHTPYAVCVSCMIAKAAFKIPAMTPGYLLRVGDLPVVPFYSPGSTELADSVERIIAERDSVLLSKHGIVTVGKTMQAAINLAEEVEENAKIFVLGGERAIGLTPKEEDSVRKIYA
jgi:3-dehydro-4-phosphotetronate decarboxylase